MTPTSFMDTNVLLWAAGGTPDQPWKVPIARRLLLGEIFGVSAQTLAEFINAATRARRLKIAADDLDLWVAYLAGVSLAFSRGTLRIFQTVASRTAKRPSTLPPTRADLYR